VTSRAFLRIYRDGSKVAVGLDTMTSGLNRPVLLFANDRGDELDAEMLARHLQETFGDIVQKARSDAYASGYRDGRARCGKTQWFSRWLGREMP
jgi:hypothetical protein